MKYFADRPIRTKADDLLGRASFSKQLGKSICEYTGNDGLVVGLFGKWGTGKTSIINMAIDEIRILTKDDNNKPFIMHFSPWNYSDKDNLISLFFRSLKNQLDRTENSKKKNKIQLCAQRVKKFIYINKNDKKKKELGQALSNYSEAFEIISLLPIFGSGLLASILKDIGKSYGKDLLKEKDLDTSRDELEQVLINLKQKIIVVIDDIDRLSNSQIRDIFQLVKQVGDFPNIIYVLSMDRDVVCRALNEVHDINGKEYLEKIIQVPFEIPEIKKANLKKIFLSKINQVLKEIPGEITDITYWEDILKNCIEPYIKTLRDINRVVNAFRFRYGLLYQETSLEDMLAITTIEVLEPSLYKWISNNKDSVCRTFIHRLSSMQDNKKNSRELYSKIFKELNINSERAIGFLITMFPAFENNLSTYSSYREELNIRGNKRIAHKEKFELYFMYNLDDIKVPRSTIEACIYDFDLKTLIKAIEGIDYQGRSQYFLEELESLVTNIPKERLGLIASAMLKKKKGFKGEDLSQLNMIFADETAIFIIIKLIGRIESEEEKYNILYAAVESVNESNLGTIASIINSIKLAYERVLVNSESVAGLIISEEHLKSIEELYILKITDIVKANQLFDLYKSNISYSLWQRLDKDNADRYLTQILKDKMNILKFICAIAYRSNGTNGCSWKFDLDSYSLYISKEKICNVIQTLTKNELDKFSKVNQIKIATFLLDCDKKAWDHINDVKAQKLVDKWSNE